MLHFLLKGYFPRPQRAIFDDAAIRYSDAPTMQLPNVNRVAMSRQVCCWCIGEPMLFVSDTRRDKPVSLEAPRRPWEVVLRDVGGSDSGVGVGDASTQFGDAQQARGWRRCNAGSYLLRRPRRGRTLDVRGVPDGELFCLIPCPPSLPFLTARESRHQRCVINDWAISMREVTLSGCFRLLNELSLDRVAAVLVPTPWGAAVVWAAPYLRNVVFTVQGVKGPEGAKAFTSMLTVKDAVAVKEPIEVRKRALMERISQILTEAIGLDRSCCYDSH
ncbi:hypothetical protein DFJ73DRAFT_766909 [Zopfochytrium polystomum]|nr:hypothetical protein DFJ73DRAFT_766909 [Zopfochytrium polystomum]